jgi:hypothetical protein
LFSQVTAVDGWRTFQVTTRVEVLKPSGTTRIWVPAALMGETPFQKTFSNTFNCDGGTAKLIESKTDALGIIAAEFPPGVKPVLTVTNQIATKDCAVDLAARGTAPKESREELQHFLRPTKLLPTDGIVKATATEITKGAKTDVEKARLITPFGIRRRAAAALATFASCWSPKIWAANAQILTRSTLDSPVRPDFRRATFMASALLSPNWGTRASGLRQRT